MTLQHSTETIWLHHGMSFCIQAFKDKVARSYLGDPPESSPRPGKGFAGLYVLQYISMLHVSSLNAPIRQVWKV